MAEAWLRILPDDPVPSARPADTGGPGGVAGTGGAGSAGGAAEVGGAALALDDPAQLILTCANCGATMDERKCKLICRCGYFLSCSDYY